MKFTVLLLSVLILLLNGAVKAQQVPDNNTTSPSNSSEQTGNAAFWQAKFVNGGHYMVKLSAINSVSRHEYTANVAAKVTEVTIATNASVVARFYWFEPVGGDSSISAANVMSDRTKDMANSAAQRVSPSATKLHVTKDYPQTTHSHTVEYALQSKEELASLYTSLTDAVENNRGRIWLETPAK